MATATVGICAGTQADTNVDRLDNFNSHRPACPSDSKGKHAAAQLIAVSSSAKSNESASLILTTPIRANHANRSTSAEPLENITNFDRIAFAISEKANHIYIWQEASQQVERQTIGAEGNGRVLVATGVDCCDALADSLSLEFYCSCVRRNKPWNNTITSFASNSGSSNATTNITVFGIYSDDPFIEIVSFALDQTEKLIFWSATQLSMDAFIGHEGVIEVMQTNGLNRRRVLGQPNDCMLYPVCMRYPTALTLDAKSKRLIWQDAYSRFIWSASYEGSDQRVISRRKDHHPGTPAQMIYHECKLYWSARFPSQVIQHDLATNTSKAVYQTDGILHAGIAVITAE